MWIYVYFAIVPFAQLYFAMWIHVIGHALGGRLAGFSITSLGVGVGAPFLKFKVGSTAVFFGARNILSELTFGIGSDLPPSPRNSLLFYSGGVLANLAACLVSLGLLLSFKTGAYVWLMGLFCNACWVGNLLPYQVKFGGSFLASDGMAIRELLRGRAFGINVLGNFQALDRFRTLLKGVGDHATLRYQLTFNASLWLQLGDFETASELLREADELEPCDIPTYLGFREFVTAELHAALGNDDDAEGAFLHAASIFQRAGAESGTAQVALAFALFRESRGIDPAGTVEDVARRHAKVLGRSPATSDLAPVHKMLAVAARRDEEGTQTVFPEYLPIRFKASMLARDLAVDRYLLEMHLSLGDTRAAVGDYLRIRLVLELLIQGCTDSFAKNRLSRLLEEFNEQVSHALAGEPQPVPVIIDSAAFNRFLAERRSRVWSRRLLVLNLTALIAAAVGTAWIVLTSPTPPFRNNRLVGAFLLYGVAAIPHFVLAGIYFALLKCTRLNLPEFRRDPDGVLLGLMISPWIWTIVFVFVAFR